MSNNLFAAFTPAQIRRHANNYDSQIRLGLEDGSIWQVVKRLGTDMGTFLGLRLKGTQEQRDAFLHRLFLYQFPWAWNDHYQDTNFVDNQLEKLARFDASQSGLPTNAPVTPPPVACTPLPSYPPPPQQSGPSHHSPPPTQQQPPPPSQPQPSRPIA